MIYPNKFRNLDRLDRWLRAGCYTALALAVLFLFRCVYDSILHERFSKTPADLTRSVELTEAIFGNRQAFDTADDSDQMLTASHSVPLSPEPYATDHICTPLRTSRLRSQPEVYPVQSLQGSSGFDAFSAKSSDRKQQGCRWIVVTGIVEFRQQELAFAEALRGAAYRNAVLDSPVYETFFAERAEIAAGGDDHELHWQPRPVQAMYDVRNNWPQFGADPVAAKFCPPTCGGIALVFPVGPRLNGVWGDEVGNPRLAIYETEMKKIRSLPPVSTPPDDHDSFGNGHTGNPTPRPVNDSVSASIAPDVRLVRFFDYDVQPGAKYRYRVKLVLRNPNYRVAAKFLKEEALGSDSVLATSWSEPTVSIAVPPATTVAVVAASAARGWAEVKVTHFDLETGDYQAGEFSVERGQTLNFYGQEFYPPANSLRTTDANPLLPPPVRQKPPAPELVDYVTDLLLVDCWQGCRLPGRRQAAPPAAILVMDADGTLRAVEEDLHPASARSKAPVNQIAGRAE
jgi:hypothetical protein